MDKELRIISVDQIGHDLLLIYLADGSVVELTIEQLLNSGIPRNPVPPDDESFQAAVRSALDRTRID